MKLLYFFLEVSGTEEDCAKWVKLTLRLTSDRHVVLLIEGDRAERDCLETPSGKWIRVVNREV